jgi:YgiT-type zinc finger domain-containing protein
MGQDKCCFCDGKLKKGSTDLVIKVDDEIISIKDIPACICENCGEKFFTPDISRKIDEVMKEYFEGKLSSRPIKAREVELPA